MNPRELFDLLSERIHGERARDLVAAISAFHRVQASPGFRQAAEYVAAELGKAPIPAVQILQFPADGKTRYYKWEAPIAWRIEGGQLRLLEPEKRLIGDYSELALHISTHSQAAQVVAEVVDVGPGTEERHYAGRDVRGKIVMATAGARGAHTMAVRRGAVGVIAYPSSERAAGHPEMVLYDGIWPDSRTRHEVTFGCSISRRWADRLLGFMAEGKTVKVQATVQAELYDGMMDVVEALLPCPASSGREILLVAHLCHPKPCANDNASGSGLLLELMRVLAEALTSGAVPGWRHDIRALWVPEFHGTAAYLQRFEGQVQQRVLACLNLDMVGESPERVGFPFTVTRTALSTPSVLDDLLRYCVEQVRDSEVTLSARGSRRPMNVRFSGYSGGSDHVLTSNATFGKPSVMLGHGDVFHHTALDTIDMVDSSELKRVGMIAALATAMLACPQEAFAARLAAEAFAGGAERLASAAARWLAAAYAGEPVYEMFPDPGDQARLAARQLQLLYHHEEALWQDLAQVYQGVPLPAAEALGALRGQAELYQKLLAGLAPASARRGWADPRLERWDGMRVQRHYRGLLCSKWIYAELEGEEKRLWEKELAPRFAVVEEELYNLADGRRSLVDILLLLQLEHEVTQVAEIERLLTLWQKLGLVRLRRG
jgi:aminopeptidase-like protein